MTLGIMQPYFFPYIGYFQLIHAVDTFILYGNLPFQKRTWMSRNRILIKGQSEQFIFVPLIGKSNSSLISETEINLSRSWRLKMLQTLFHNYTGSDYFEETFSALQPLILSDCQNLHDYNAAIIKGLCKVLRIQTLIRDDNTPYIPLEDSLKAEYGANKESTDVDEVQRKTQRIIRLCKQEQAQSYINLSGGVNLYSKDVFEKHAIRLSFIRRKDFSYGQFSKTFVPDLSIIDVLMHNGFLKTRELLDNYELF